MLSAEFTPAIAGAYSDPTVCRVGDAFYLANSSFEYFPGAPVHHSTDLAAWRPIGNILTRREQFDRGDGAASGGIFGSTLRYHDGRFWFITTNVSGGAPVQTLVTATSAEGPWSDPVRIDVVGIDPDLAWDDDGTCYLTWCAIEPDPFRSSIRQTTIDPRTGSVLEPPYELWSGTGLAFPEGPHLYQRGGFWYLLIAEGGTERGHSVSVARGTSPTGPFESCPANPVLSRRGIAHPVQNTGHADLVELADGSWAAVYLGVRPRGVAPGFYTLGRETFVAGVDWDHDDWPVFRPGARWVQPAVARVLDVFDVPELDPRWVVPGGEPESIATLAADGGLDLRRDDRGDPASLLCTRMQHLAWSATTTFDLTDRRDARMVVRLDDRHWYAIEAYDGTASAVARVGDLEQRWGSVEVGAAVARLRIRAQPPARTGVVGVNVGPDEIILEAADETGDFVELVRLDGRYLTSEVAGGFTGRVIGIGARSGAARVREFRYEGEDPA